MDGFAWVLYRGIARNYTTGGLGTPTRGTRFPIKGARLLIVQKLAFGNEWSQVDFFPNGG